MTQQEGKSLFTGSCMAIVACLIIAGANVLMKGGCEAARQDSMKREAADNKQWQDGEKQKAQLEELERMRKKWNENGR